MKKIIQRSGESISTHWLGMNRIFAGLDTTYNTSDAREQFPTGATNGRMRRMMNPEAMFPFRIYQTPPAYLAAPNPGTDWLNFVVRGGLYYGTAATGTDGETHPYAETFPVTDGLGTGVITVPSGTAKYWFWVTAAGAVGSGVTLPGAGETQLGWVDTSDTTNSVPVIRQIQTGDITAGGSLNLKSPTLELDPTVTVAVNTIVYLSPFNPLVTTGLIDWISGGNITSRPGFWIARKSVPAQQADPDGHPAGTYYNVPQLPYPGATGTPAGTPLAGDADGTNVFWLFLAEAPAC